MHRSHLTRHIKIPPPLASTCTVSSLHVISKSHPLWQVHAQSHRYTSYQNPTPSGKYMHSLILHVISKSHPLWQEHTKSHFAVHMKIPPPLAGTCTVSSYKSYQNPTPSGKYMHSLILHVISESHPLWQVHAKSRLTRHIKIPPPLASTCTVSSYTSYQNPTPSGKYKDSHISHYTIKIPPPLASTCTVSSYTSYQNPTPSGKYMHSLTLHVISKSHPLWQVHAQSHLTRHIKIPPPLASTCTVSSYTFTDLGLRSIVYEPWFTSHGLRSMVYEPWFTSYFLRSIVYEPWFTNHGLRSIVYEPWFTEAEVNRFDPLWREVEVNKPFNIFVQRGWGGLIPYEEKWKWINHSTYLFRGGGGFDPLWREVNVNKLFHIFFQSGWGIWSPYEDCIPQ